MRVLEHLDDRSERILRVQLDDFRGLARVQPDVRAQREHGELLDQALQYLRRERRFSFGNNSLTASCGRKPFPYRRAWRGALKGSARPLALGDSRIFSPLRPAR